MKHLSRNFILLCIVILFNFYTFSQTPQNTFNIPPPALSNGATYDYKARDYIYLEPNFDYTPSGTNSFNAEIDENLVLGASLLSNQDVSSLLNRPQLNTDLEVGSISGKSTVSLAGQAVYDIPINLPPGTAGMQPQIGIQYISQRESGIMGYGWDITGLSSITRVAQNQYFDNKTAGIAFNNNDAFALNGQRLLPLTNLGSEIVYGIEAEDFSRITTHGNGSNGPSWFEVKTKEGLILEYGNTPDSKLTGLNGTGTTLVWKVNKIKDANGNYMLFEYYKENDASGEVEIVIKKISYTGNASLGIAFPLMPYNIVEFYYDKRPDPCTKYISGKTIKSTLVLRQIKTYAESKLATIFKFKYKYDLYTKLVAIDEIVEGGKSYNSTLID